MLQVIGASDFTVDTNYEQQKQNYNSMLKTFQSIQNEMKKQPRIAGISRSAIYMIQLVQLRVLFKLVSVILTIGKDSWVRYPV